MGGLDLCDAGKLFTEEVVSNIMRTAILAVIHLHSRGIAHLDLKVSVCTFSLLPLPVAAVGGFGVDEILREEGDGSTLRGQPENFLFKDQSDQSVIKVSDFGFSKILHRNETIQDMAGTPQYIGAKSSITVHDLCRHHCSAEWKPHFFLLAFSSCLLC